MDWNIVIYTAIGAGLGGVLGGQFAKLIAQKKNNPDTNAKEVTKKPFVGIPIIIGVFLLPFLYKNMTLPRIIPVDFIQAVKGEPAVQEMLMMLKEHEPETYKTFTYAIDKITRNGGNADDGYKEGEKLGKALAAEKMKYADSNFFRIALEVAQDTFVELKTPAPKQCVNLFYDRPLELPTGLKSKDLTRREEVFFIDLIKLERTGETTFSMKIAQEAQSKVVIKLSEFLTDTDNMDPPASATMEVHRRMCDIGYFTMGQILELDNEELVHFMRWSLQPENN